MKALSLWQPWASLMAHKYKRIETRGWSTDHRGDVVIHAAKTRDVEAAILWEREQACGAIPRHYGSYPMLPFGRALCIVELFQVVPTDWLLHSHEDTASYLRTEYLSGHSQEERYGNYEKGRFAWLTRRVRAMNHVAIVGRQKLFNVDEAEMRAALR